MLFRKAVERINKTKEGVAIHGYDPVAYFLEGQPTRGRKEFGYDWRGATWYFDSAANRDLFADNPEKYAPQYGGYCAFAVSVGQTADIAPDAWKIVDDRLYLNFNKAVRTLWEFLPNRIPSADKRWPKLRDR